jgi:hypothetical protein
LSLTLVASSPAAALIWAARERSYAALPESVRETLLEHEAAKTFKDPEYEEAAKFFRFSRTLEDFLARVEGAPTLR